MVYLSARAAFQNSQLLDPAFYDLSDGRLLRSPHFGLFTFPRGVVVNTPGVGDQPMTVFGGSRFVFGVDGLASSGTITTLLHGAGSGDAFSHLNWAITGLSVDLPTLQTAIASGQVLEMIIVVGGMLSGNDVFRLSNDDDRANGYSGNDVLIGNGGNDWLFGDNGNDRIIGGTGQDLMSGGAGNDRYYVDDPLDSVQEFETQSDLFRDMGGYDQVYSTVSFSLSVGRSGTYVEGLKLVGSADIDGRGNNSNNVLVGNDGANGLTGVDGADVLKGMGGSDRLRGGAGSDKLFGGVGADTFLFDDWDRATPSLDTIYDFSRAENDRIDVSGVDADVTNKGTNDTFIWIGDAVFHGQPGELRVAHTVRNTLVQLDCDGNGVADLTIRLSGLVTLQETDFVL
jgi:Ca2+-binding RTX toxin-like protein